VQQTGFERPKRGYKQIRGIPVPEATAHQNNEKTKQLPNDPLYSKQWYIVSKTTPYNLVVVFIINLAQSPLSCAAAQSSTWQATENAEVEFVAPRGARVNKTASIAKKDALNNNVKFGSHN